MHSAPTSGEVTHTEEQQTLQHLLYHDLLLSVTPGHKCIVVSIGISNKINFLFYVSIFLYPFPQSIEVTLKFRTTSAVVSQVRDLYQQTIAVDRWSIPGNLVGGRPDVVSGGLRPPDAALEMLQNGASR